MNSTRRILICIAIFLLASCEHTVNESTKPTGADLSFDDIRDTVFSVCLPCHSGNTTNGGLDLSQANNIINKPSNGVPGIVYIRPNVPDSSYIYLKINGSPGIVGDRMPPSGSLSEKNITILRDWILDGAP